MRSAHGEHGADRVPRDPSGPSPAAGPECVVQRTILKSSVGQRLDSRRPIELIGIDGATGGFRAKIYGDILHSGQLGQRTAHGRRTADCSLHTGHRDHDTRGRGVVFRLDRRRGGVGIRRCAGRGARSVGVRRGTAQWQRQQQNETKLSHGFSLVPKSKQNKNENSPSPRTRTCAEPIRASQSGFASGRTPVTLLRLGRPTRAGKRRPA